MIQILHILLVQCLWTEERQSLCKSFLSIHCNRPSAHLLSVEDIFLLSWQDAFNQETARAMSFSLLWYHSLYCGVCLVWWFAWQPLIRDVRDVSDRQGPVVPWQGVQVGAPCKYLSTNWISQRRAGWTCQPGSSTTAGTPPSAPPPLTHRGTKCWKISGIRWAVCFPAKATQGVPIKVPDRFQELAWPVSARSNNHFYHRTGLHKLWQLAAT